MSKNENPAVAEYEAAKAELEEVSKRDRAETDAYLAANDRVAEAARNVSWWRR
ncbi:hypothetical protein MOQ72_41880 [Saccharopolyspora sp. K220]|uniref:hypothetical protein n=1 Tax=Saccharopolyspora soli TaxID=2926618 RepID=UPI001F5928E9|nr:hypothetical protein [Saccharopolyspora soli]MCI2423969.1 hypothetical protein [Saccharopolyspora soli]